MDQKQTIDSILQSLDGVQKASPAPFFYARVRARLEREESGFWSSLAYFLSKPTVALATLCFILVLNLAAFFYQKETTSAVTDQNEQTLTEDYNTTLAANSYYEDNN